MKVTPIIFPVYHKGIVIGHFDIVNRNFIGNIYYQELFNRYKQNLKKNSIVMVNMSKEPIEGKLYAYDSINPRPTNYTIIYMKS